MPGRYFEVRVAADIDSGDLVGELDDPNLLGAWEGDGAIHLYWKSESWRPGVIESIAAAIGRLGCPAGTSCTVGEAVEADWNALWALSLRPLAIGPRIVIRQSWHEPIRDPDAGVIELVIDPMRAFGTGHHASTRLLLEALQDRIRGGETVLDAGTGSGILAMAALRLGAGSALGVDVDETAIECARQYAAANGFGPELDLRVVSFADLPPATHDVVLGNLDRPTLLGLAEPLARLARPGGIVLASGILVEDGAEVSAALAEAALTIMSTRESEGWLALEAAA